jgi:hypothetical protein
LAIIYIAGLRVVLGAIHGHLGLLQNRAAHRTESLATCCMER